MLDFPVAPPIFIKDTPHKRKLTTLAEARAFVDEMLHRRRLYKLREVKTRLEILPYHANPRRNGISGKDRPPIGQSLRLTEPACSI